MKTKKFLSAAFITLSFLAISATHPATGNAPLTTGSALQCGVTNEQITAYLQGAPHYHTVYSVWDIPGTCNSNASIENCQIATVYVSAGRILGHVHSSGGICE